MQSIIITGTSTGIGQACVKRLSQCNIHLIATYRGKIPDYLVSFPNVSAIPLELADEHSVVTALEKIYHIHQSFPLQAIVSNAGYGQYGPVEDLDRTRLNHQMQVNYLGAAQLITGTIPLLRETQGRIVIVSSVLGFTSTPLRGAYAASKYALEALADTLRLELHTANIKTILIEPGPVKTAFRETACQHLAALLEQKPHSHYQYLYTRFLNQTQKTKGTITAGDVAQCIDNALYTANPRARYRLTRQTKLAWLGKRLLSSGWLDKITLKYKA